MYDFNAAEIFKMAVRIEENGAAFYRKAAGLQPEAENKKMLMQLAAMEDGHKLSFQKMSADVKEAEKTGQVFDPADESALYLSAMVDSHGGEGSPSAADALTGKETMAQILTTAIGLEQGSILFYLGIKDLVPPNLGRKKVDDIINEERKHVIQLNTLLRKIKNR